MFEIDFSILSCVGDLLRVAARGPRLQDLPAGAPHCQRLSPDQKGELYRLELMSMGQIFIRASSSVAVPVLFRSTSGTGPGSDLSVKMAFRICVNLC